MMAIEQDLNEAPLVDDPQEMINYPAQDEVQEAKQQIVHLPPHQEPAAVDINPAINSNVPEPIENAQVQLPILQAPLENFLHFEIQEDDLMDLDLEHEAEQDEEQEQPEQPQPVIQPEQQNSGVDAVVHENIHLGLVRTFFVNPPMTPGPSQMPWEMPALMGQKDANDKTVIEVPKDGWASFRLSYWLQPTTIGPSSFFRLASLICCKMNVSLGPPVPELQALLL